MIEYKDGRTLEHETVIEVYRNLHKPDFFSIRGRKSKLVLAHGNGFLIKNAKCFVGKGRLKVLRENVRNVHAYLIGEYVDECEFDTDNLQEIYYNPFTHDSFINKETGEKLEYISCVYFVNGKAYMNEVK